MNIKGLEIKDIKNLLKMMADHGLTELDIADGENRIHLKRGGEVVQTVMPAMAPMAVPAAPQQAAIAAPAAEAAEKLIEIKSPMVGTFYAAPSPDSSPYATIGAAVANDSVVCIVEAMKVMNEIQAECVGTIAEVCVKNAQPVEYGQVLFKVRPN